MKRIYVDTSALIALLDASSEDHDRVVGDLERADAEGASLVTTSYVLVEAGALVRRRLGPAAFRRLGEQVSQSVQVVWVDDDLHARAWSKAAASSRRGPDLVDWTGMLAMQDLGIEEAITLDAHFRVRGVRVRPGG